MVIHRMVGMDLLIDKLDVDACLERLITLDFLCGNLLESTSLKDVLFSFLYNSYVNDLIVNIKLR